jgi:hypothetical protein
MHVNPYPCLHEAGHPSLHPLIHIISTSKNHPNAKSSRNHKIGHVACLNTAPCPGTVKPSPFPNSLIPFPCLALNLYSMPLVFLYDEKEKIVSKSRTTIPKRGEQRENKGSRKRTRG